MDQNEVNELVHESISDFAVALKKKLEKEAVRGKLHVTDIYSIIDELVDEHDSYFFTEDGGHDESNGDT